MAMARIFFFMGRVGFRHQVLRPHKAFGGGRFSSAVTITFDCLIQLHQPRWSRPCRPSTKPPSLFIPPKRPAAGGRLEAERGPEALVPVPYRDLGHSSCLCDVPLGLTVVLQSAGDVERGSGEAHRVLARRDPHRSCHCEYLECPPLGLLLHARPRGYLRYAARGIDDRHVHVKLSEEEPVRPGDVLLLYVADRRHVLERPRNLHVPARGVEGSDGYGSDRPAPHETALEGLAVDVGSLLDDRLVDREFVCVPV